MKQSKAFSILIVFLLLISLTSSGCGEIVSADKSDDLADLFAQLPPQDESHFPPLSDEPAEEVPAEPDAGETETPDETIPSGEETPTPQVEEESTPPSETDPSLLSEEEAPLPDGRSEAQEETPPAQLSEYDTYLAACAKENVNVRAGAGTNRPILFTLKKGDSLPYLEKTGDWLKVKTDSGVGYLYGKYAYLAETSAAIENVIRAGLKKIGTPYKWGAPRILTDKGTINPYFTGKSFDCSSFVQYCYYVGCGIKLGNYTGSQADYTVGEKIASYSSLKRGDFYFTGTDKISHVVIYLGNGYLLQTFSANGGPVMVTTDERWKAKFISGRRPDLTVTDQYK